ncbi:MAG: acylphosphatase, partial [Candidatus Eisenbacteria bacterium]
PGCGCSGGGGAPCRREALRWRGTLVSRRALLSGRVQGVGFRYYTMHAAGHHPVDGFVRNLHDGTVEVEAQGLPEAVDAFLAEVRKGAPGSRVSDLRVEPAPLETGEKGFRIRY